MIDLIYKTVQTIINKENNGYLSPTEFNILANNVQMEIFRNYFEDENKDKNKENRGLTNKGYSNLDFNQRQRINQFSEITDIPLLEQKFSLPEDLYIIEDDGITVLKMIGSVYTEQSVVEEAERSILGYLNKSSVSPSETYPVYERYAKHIIVYPNTIDKIRVRYIRTPKMPKWTYFIVSNKEMFDPSNTSFQDFELDKSEFSNIVVRMLSYFSINIREEEVVKIAETLKDKITLKDNE